MTPIRILVRTKTPWETMTAESFRAQTDPKSPTEFIRLGRDVIPVWERATGLGFYSYRSEIRDICETKLRLLGHPVTVGIQGVDWGGPDELLAPIDDDDTFLAGLPLEVSDSVNLLVWNRTTNYLRQERKENPKYGGQLDTCNWAVRKSFLRQWHIAEREFILARHWTAAGLMAPRFGQPLDNSLMGRAKRSVVVRGPLKLEHPSIVTADETWSIYYLHSASISFLCHKVGEHRDLEGYLRGLPLHPLYE